MTSDIVWLYHEQGSRNDINDFQNSLLKKEDQIPGEVLKGMAQCKTILSTNVDWSLQIDAKSLDLLKVAFPNIEDICKKYQILEEMIQKNKQNW